MEKVFEKIKIEGAKIIWRNFQGRGTDFNKEGDRNFTLIISDPDDAQRLSDIGWNVKAKVSKTDPEAPVMYTLKVKVGIDPKPGIRPPKCVLIVNGQMTELDPDTIGILDQIDYNDIKNIDLVVRPYNYSIPGGNEGVSAYLEEIWVTQEPSGFLGKYQAGPDEVSFV